MFKIFEMYKATVHADILTFILFHLRCGEIFGDY